MASQVLRFVFANGTVREKRGTDVDVAMAFELDENRIIDYVISMEVESGECAFFTREDDTRYDEEVIFTSKTTFS